MLPRVQAASPATLSQPPDATYLPSGLKTTENTISSYDTFATSFPESNSQTRAIWPPPDTTYLPSGLNATDITLPSWLVVAVLLLAIFQIRMLVSLLPD